MLFKDWFNEFYEVYCVDVIAYDCHRDYWYINQNHFACIADMELSAIKPIDIQRVIKSTMSGYVTNQLKEGKGLFQKKILIKEEITVS